MNWINLETGKLDSPEFIGSTPLQRGIWLSLLRYCAGQENGGVITACRKWADIQWNALVRVSRDDVRQKCALWRWDGENLEITHYPTSHQEKTHRLRMLGFKKSPEKAAAARKNGASGGRPRKKNPTRNRTKTQPKVREGNVTSSSLQEEEEVASHSASLTGAEASASDRGYELDESFKPTDYLEAMLK